MRARLSSLAPEREEKYGIPEPGVRQPTYSNDPQSGRGEGASSLDDAHIMRWSTPFVEWFDTTVRLPRSTAFITSVLHGGFPGTLRFGDEGSRLEREKVEMVPGELQYHFEMSICLIES